MTAYFFHYERSAFSQRSGRFVQTACDSVFRALSNKNSAGISVSATRPCNSGETRQSLNPAFFRRNASSSLSGNSVKQSTQTQSTFPDSVSAVSIDSNSDIRTAQRLSPTFAYFTKKGNDWSKKK